jgi:hypothetical protein
MKRDSRGVTVAVSFQSREQPELGIRTKLVQPAAFPGLSHPHSYSGWQRLRQQRASHAGSDSDSDLKTDRSGRVTVDGLWRKVTVLRQSLPWPGTVTTASMTLPWQGQNARQQWLWLSDANECWLHSDGQSSIMISQHNMVKLVGNVTQNVCGTNALCQN